MTIFWKINSKESIKNADECKKLDFNFEQRSFFIGANDILEVLDLSWNHIRGKGAIAIARGIGVRLDPHFIVVANKDSSVWTNK